MRETLSQLYSLRAYTNTVERQRAINLYWISTIFGALAIGFSLFNPNLEGAGIITAGIAVLLVSLSISLTRIGQRRLAAVLVTLGIIIALFVRLNSPLIANELTSIISFGILLVMIATSLVLNQDDILLVNGVSVLLASITVAVGGSIVNPIDADQHGLIAEIGFIIFAALVGGIAWILASSLENLGEIQMLGAARRSLLLSQTSTNVSQQIVAQLDLQTLLDATVDLIRDQFEDIYHAQVFLINQEKNNAELRASTGEVGRKLMERRHALGVGSVSVIGRVTQTGNPVLASAASHDPVHRANELLPETRTELAVPLRSREGIIGALDVQSQKTNAFTQDDIDILQSLADQIAIAVENARLFQQAQEEAQRAKALAEVSQIASTMPANFEEGLQQLLQTTATAGAFTHWWFGTVDSEKKHLVHIAGHSIAGATQPLPSVFDLVNDRNTLVEAYHTAQPIIMNGGDDAASSLMARSVELLRSFGRHIAAPVFSPDGRRVIGALLVGRAHDAAYIDQGDTELVTSLTSQISIALENRRLFKQAADERQLLQSVLNTMPISVLVSDPDGVITLANEQAQVILGEGIQVGGRLAYAYPLYQTSTNEPYPTQELPQNRALLYKRTFAAEDLSVIHPDGKLIDLLSKAAPILDDAGDISAVVSVFQDITEMRELERALQESLSETTKLYEASRAISHAAAIEEVRDAVLGQMLTLAPDQVYMTLLHPGEKEKNAELILAYPKPMNDLAETGLPPQILLPESGLGTTNLTFATHSLHLLQGINENDIEQLHAQGIHALSVLPLEARGEVFGAIVGVFGANRHFAPEERRFLLTLADQTAVSLNAVLSFNRTEETLKSISNLYQASRTIAEVQDVDEVLQVVQEQLMQLQPDHIDIALNHDQEGLSRFESVLTWTRDSSQVSLPLNDMAVFDPFSRDEYYIEDLLADPNNPLAQLLQDSPYVAAASLPFRAAGQPTGRLTVTYKKAHPFSIEDRQFLRMLADSTAYVIENDMLFKQTQDSLEETGILYQAIRAFANADDKEGILQAIIDYAADPAVDKALLCLLLTEQWHSPNALMEVVVSWVRGDSVDLTGMRFTAEQFPSWEQIATSSILWVDDVMEDTTLDDTARMGYRALDIGSFVVVPLVTSQKPIGAILLGSSEARHHTEREIRIYQSLADQAAITMENIRLYEEAERRARQLATSARVSQAASSILQIDELLPEMVELIKEAFTYDHVQVFLLNDEGTKAMLQASTGESGRQLLAIRHSLEVGSRSVIGTVTATGKPSIALDTADARVIHKPNPYLPNTRSEMAIPLVSRGKILGALDVQSNQPGAFTENDERVLTVLADQLAVAIENAALFELSQRRSEEMGFLFTVAAESAASRRVEDILSTVSELLLQQMNANLVVPYLYNDPIQSLELVAVASTATPAEIEKLTQIISIDSDDITIQVASSKMPALLKNIDYDMLEEHHRLPSIHSGVYLPLITGERLVGVLALESEKPFAFDDNVLNLLQALTGTLAAVIYSSRLFSDLQAANERLREVDKLKTNFLAAMSHELRTPLNSIIGFSRVILKGIDGPVTDMQRQDLQTIHDSGKHLLGLVNDILDQAKIEAGKMELSKDYFDLGAVIKGVMSSAEGLTKEKSIRLYTEIPSDLPQAYGDEFRTRQILFNLISNAAKFTEQGSITTSAYIIHKDAHSLIKVSVTDTGIGIREEDFPKLFESFQQVDNSTTRSAEGTGLGLPLARSLTELQGGEIELQSEVGVGSTFSVTIPLAPPEEKAKEPVETEKAASNGKAARKVVETKNVVVVEDNIDMMNLYRRHLSNNGYDVVGVTSGNDALEKMMSLRPVALILNVNINNDGGWEILTQIKETDWAAGVPVIVSSLHEETDRSKEAGAEVHLVRPFSPEDLIAAVQQVESKVSS